MIATKGRYFVKYYPQHMILLSLISATIIGTVLLALPVSQVGPRASYLDLFFTAASLTTVTGLLTLPLQHFTHFGHIVMLCLMQLGGLGVMTLSLCFVYMFSNLGIYTQVVASEILTLKSFKDTKQTLFFIIKLTIITECIGACIIFPTLYRTYPLKKAIFLSIFHSVASFCNAGFSLFDHGMASYLNHPLMLLTTTLLMIAGGVGFVTWKELVSKFFSKNTQTPCLMIWHTKLVLRVYFYTSMVASLLFWLIERNGVLAPMSPLQKLSVVLFTGISMKSTGFTLVSFTLVQVTTLVVAMISMFIGSAPLSTGSGIKTTVFAIYLAIIKAAIQGKRQVLLYGRQIVDDQVYKAMAILTLSISWIVIITFFLLITEQNLEFITLLFTTIAAFSNNGTAIFSMDLLSSLGKCLIIISMFIGRIGALALILSMRRIAEVREISYPKEHVILG